MLVPRGVKLWVGGQEGLSCCWLAALPWEHLPIRWQLGCLRDWAESVGLCLWAACFRIRCTLHLAASCHQETHSSFLCNLPRSFAVVFFWIWIFSPKWGISHSSKGCSKIYADCALSGKYYRDDWNHVQACEDSMGAAHPTGCILLHGCCASHRSHSIAWVLCSPQTPSYCIVTAHPTDSILLHECFSSIDSILLHCCSSHRLHPIVELKHLGTACYHCCACEKQLQATLEKWPSAQKTEKQP